MSAAAPSNRKWKIALVAAFVAGPMLGALTTAWAVQTFPDVPPSNIFYDEIEWGAANNIINGYTNGNFGPNDNVTRGASAAFLSHYNDAIHTVTTIVDPGPANAFAIQATCPVGERAIGGWGDANVGNVFTADTYVVTSGRAYKVIFESENNASANPTRMSATAVCAPDSVANPVSAADTPPPVEEVE